MLAKDLTSERIPVVNESDTVSDVIRNMTEFKVSHLPVVIRESYMGLIAEKDILAEKDIDQPVKKYFDHLLLLSVLPAQHIYEVIDLISRNSLTLLPVVTPASQYAGSITLPILIKNINILTAAGEPGAIFVLKLASQDYSSTILSRIVEESNAKILSLYVRSNPEGRDQTVTLKINSQETNSLMRTFDRYGYSVESCFLADGQMDDFYRSRYEEFMKYMNI